MKISYFKLLIISVSLSSFLVFVGCSNNKRVEDAIKDYVVKENKRYPLKVDSQTTLDTCLYIYPNILQYQYLVSDVGVLDTIAVKQHLKENLILSIKIDQGTAYFRNNNVQFQYQYRNQDRQYLFQLNIAPEDYK